MSKAAARGGILWLLLSFASRGIAADLSAFAGRWQLDPARTSMGRFGPTGRNMVRDPSFTFIFNPTRSGLRQSVYAHFPQDRPTRISAIVADGKVHRCAAAGGCLTNGGNPREQNWIYNQIAPHFLVRRFFVKGKVTEYTSYAVDPAMRTFTMIAWSAETPQWQNIQVFVRQPPAVTRSTR